MQKSDKVYHLLNELLNEEESSDYESEESSESFYDAEEDNDHETENIRLPTVEDIESEGFIL